MPRDDGRSDDWAGEPDPRADDWADYSEPGDDDELNALTADIGTILAGRTVLPAAFLWWRTRRERRAVREADSAKHARRTRWFEI